MTDERPDRPEQEDEPEPEVEVESDPTVVYVPLPNRSAHPVSRAEAEGVAGLTGYAIVVDRGPRSGMTYLLRPGNTTVGRHPDSDIFLDDVTVSRHHCRFVVKEGSVMVEDSGSTNGTYVNGERADQAELQPGDEVIVGRFHFVVARGNA